ncbi:MAG: LysR family transcriptional regulator [Raoultibacter sp.]
METEYLREYVVFSQQLNYAKAAETLFLSQPTLRAHIKALEDELGASLTIKRDNQFVLSPAGKYFLKKARDIIKLADEATETSRTIAENSASLVIGFLEYPYLEDLFIKARELLPEQHQPGLELLFSPKMHANVEAITSGEADITIYPLTRTFADRNEISAPLLPPTVSSMYIGKRECRFWLTKNNPLFEKDHIVASDLKDCTLLLGNTQNMISAGPRFQEYFDACGVSIEIDNQPYASYADYFLADMRNYFGIILEGHRLERIAREDFRIFTLEDFTVYSDLYILYDQTKLNDLSLKFLHEIEVLNTANEPA